MSTLTLKQKLVLQVVGICLTLSMITGLILYRNSQTASMYQLVAGRMLPMVEDLGALQAEFRMIRIQVRSLGLVGNSNEDNENFSRLTKEAVGAFLKTKEKFLKNEFDEQGKKFVSELEIHWSDFSKFGEELLALSLKGDDESIAKMNHMVRVMCPVKSQLVTDVIQNFIAYQNTMTEKLVAESIDHERATFLFAVIAVVLGLVVSLVFGYLFATRVTKGLAEKISVLNASAADIDFKSEMISDVSKKISEASIQQAAGLQETVASVDEISAMISKNADGARKSAEMSESSNMAALQGKEKVEQMLESIHSISEGNNEMIAQINETNKEISDIKTVIEDIATKTQVINDIVFQTKLLSFNASVEAARAGENGKGFAVVAEEVGNLASMSGKAAEEISTILSHSTEKVNGIVEKTKVMMEELVSKSKAKINAGTSTAKDCAGALDEILANVSSVNGMVREIAEASQEQATGVREVNSAMNEMDKVTQANTLTAKEASDTASDLKAQATRLNELVASLTSILEGEK